MIVGATIDKAARYLDGFIIAFTPGGNATMNKQQDAGLGKQIKGTAKDIAGKVTGDKILQGEGKVEKTVGKVQKKVGDAQERHEIDKQVERERDGQA